LYILVQRRYGYDSALTNVETLSSISLSLRPIWVSFSGGSWLYNSPDNSSDRSTPFAVYRSAVAQSVWSNITHHILPTLSVPLL
jgi:hypothetical protein